MLACRPGRRPGHGTRASPRTRGSSCGVILLATRARDGGVVAVTEQSRAPGTWYPNAGTPVGPKSNMWMDPAQDPRLAVHNGVLPRREPIGAADVGSLLRAGSGHCRLAAVNTNIGPGGGRLDIAVATR